MKPRVEILRLSSHWKSLSGFSAIARRAVETTLAESGIETKPGVEVTISLSDDDRVRSLNSRWRGIDAPTNVLSFPAVIREQLSFAPMIGDVVLAFETIDRQAAFESKSVRDHSLHLIVHGVLHLLGYDHDTRRRAEKMESLEVHCLALLQISNPYKVGICTDATS